MKTSSVSYPGNEPILIVRQSQLQICGNNFWAAALLSHFEYWHSIKTEMQEKNRQANDIAEKHGDARTQDETAYIFFNERELEKAMMGGACNKTIRNSIKILREKRFISVHANPNPRYHFDKTRHFLFHPSVVQEAIKSINSEAENIPNPLGLESSRQGTDSSRQGLYSSTSPEISSEISSETIMKGLTHSELASESHDSSPALIDSSSSKPSKPARKEPNLSIGQKAYLKAAGRLPQMKTLTMLDQTVFEKGEDYSAEIIKQWIERGFHPHNISGICDVIRNGFYEEREKKGNGNGQNGTNGRRNETNVERNLENSRIAFDAIRRGIEASNRR